MTRYDNSAVIERLERENRELRMHCENLRSAGLALAFYQDDTDQYSEARHIVMTESPSQSLAAVRAEAVDAALRKYAQQWVEPQVKGPFSRELVYADIIDHADRLAELRNGEDNE